MILVFLMLSFKPAFSISSFTFIKRLFCSSLLSAIRVVSSVYLRLLIGRGFLSLPALWDCHSEAPGSSTPSPALTPHTPGVFCCICLPAVLLSTSPVTLLPNPVFTPPRLRGLGVGMGLSRDDMFTAGCDSVKCIFFQLLLAVLIPACASSSLAC